MVFHDPNLDLIPRLVGLYVTAHVKWILTLEQANKHRLLEPAIWSPGPAYQVYGGVIPPNF